jgi:glycosyltransferase involved in cell wall biosynthesis
VSSIPEVVGDAAQLIDPQNFNDIADGILKVLSDPAHRHRLVQRGLSQAVLFTWYKAAEGMIELFNAVGALR